MGRHKEVTCPECGFLFRVNADAEAPTPPIPPLRIVWGTCGNCRRPSRIDGEPSFAGDRIYAIKSGGALPLTSGLGAVKPERWQVYVFRQPQDPSERYIKRLVGLPGDVLRLQQGDVWVRKPEIDAPFERPRRNPAQQLQMQVPVYDDAHRPASFHSEPAWRRWVGEGWAEPKPGVFGIDASDESWAELSYRHLPPSPAQWEAVIRGDAGVKPRPTLITDYSSYNTEMAPQILAVPRLASRPWFQPHWVGDLTLSLRLNVADQGGLIRLELVEAGVIHRCEIDAATGLARLARGEEPLGEPMPTSVRGPGTYDLIFANVDDRLTLWVEGRLPFGDGATYTSGDAETSLKPTEADLEPVRILARGGRFQVSDLILRRDVYYTQEPGEADSIDLEVLRTGSSERLFEMLGDPKAYGELSPRPIRDYKVREGYYLMLGDNSPWSRDARAFSRAVTSEEGGWDDSGRESWETPAAYLIGRAFCVYWPHLQPVWPRIPLGWDVRIPARPNFEEARWIH